MSNKHYVAFSAVAALILATYLFWTLLFVFNPVFYSHLQQSARGEASSLNKPIIAYFSSPSFEPPDISPFTSEENSHLRDVKNTIYSVELVFAFLFFFLFLIRHHITSNLFRTTGIILVLLPFLFLIIPFDVLFAQFHYIIFPQGNWQFDPATTTLVNIYPEQFFQQFLQTIITYTMITGVIFILKSRYLTTTNI